MIEECEKENQLEPTTPEEKTSESIWEGIFADFFQMLLDSSAIFKHKYIVSKIENFLEKQKNKLEKDQKNFKDSILIILGLSIIPLTLGITTFKFIGIISYIVLSSVHAIPNFIFLLKRVRGNKKLNIYLEEMLIEENQIIESLEEQQNKELEQTEKDIEIIEVLRELDNQINLNYQYGYNFKKWMLYYKCGILRKRLEKKYSEKDCDKIENWLAFDTFKKEETKLLRKLER